MVGNNFDFVGHNQVKIRKAKFFNRPQNRNFVDIVKYMTNMLVFKLSFGVQKPNTW